MTSVKKLRAYFWKEHEDADTGVAVVAYNAKDAKKLGYTWWGETVGHEEEFTEQRCNLIKDADVTGLTKPQVMEDMVDGLKRNMFGYVEEDVECEVCKKMMCCVSRDDIVDNKIICEECKEKK